MTALVATFRKELLSFFVSPVSWVVGILFYWWRGVELRALVDYFARYRIDQELLPPQTYGLGSTFLMVVLVPGLLTMRSFAEERRTGSLETLLTAPIRDGEVIVGKWEAATVF